MIHVVVKGVVKCTQFNFLNKVILCFVITLTLVSFLSINFGIISFIGVFIIEQLILIRLYG